MKTTVLTILAVAAFGTLIVGAMPVAEKKAGFELDLESALSALGSHDWKILDDTSDSRLAIGRTTVTGRRVVATCRISDGAKTRIPAAFLEEIERQLEEAGAIIKGEQSVAHGASTVLADGTTEVTDIDCPRWYYAIGKDFGVLDLTSVAHDGRIVVTISYLQ